MPRTKKSKDALISADMLFIDWKTKLYAKVKEQGGTKAMIYDFFVKEEKIREVARMIINSPTKEKTIQKLFLGNDYLKLLSEGNNLEIDACDGSELLSEATDVFSYIDSDFKNYGAVEKGNPTQKTKTSVYELQKKSTFSTFFNSVSVDLNKLCFTQHQIKEFIQTHRSWLRTGGYATFFLFKSKVGPEDKFFVARVSFDGFGRLKVRVSRLESGYEWSAESEHRVVLPQLDVMS